MRKLISLMMVLTLILCCAMLAACGASNGEQSEATLSDVTADETVAGTPPTAAEETPATGGGTSGEGCSGVPRYPGASDIEEASWSWGAGQFGEYGEVEWNYYSTNITYCTN